MRDWIVLRFSSDVPPETVPEDLNGHWFDKAQINGTFNYTTERAVSATEDDTVITRSATARATGNFEVDDRTLEFAEIWEIGPWD